MTTLEKGVIPNIQGGLGNQMFMVAASYVVHKTSGVPLYILETPPNVHNIKNYDYTLNIFKHFISHHPLSENNICISDYNLFSHIQAFLPWDPSLIKAGTIMCGYFQYYPVLEPYQKEIRELFLKGLVMPEKDYSSYAFLHIRRGDYLNNPDIHYIQPLEYYEKASENFSKILVVSDDMEWVKAQEFFKGSKFELFESDNELETLAVMSSCKAGAICANSTFSWWGAFLGAYGSRNPVYVPKKWISSPIVSLFPDEWIII